MANNNNKGARQQSAAAELLRVLQDRAGDGGRAGRRRGGADKGEVVSGSSFDKLSADANGGDAHEKALAQISYNFRRTEHPVFLFMQNIQSAPGSSVTLAIEQMRKMQHAVQRIDANHEGSSFVPPPPPPVSREESTNLAVSPEGAPSLRVHDYVVLPVPLCYLKKNPTHLYDFDTSNPKAQAYAQMVSFVTSSMSDLDVSIHQEHQKKGVPEWLFRPAGDKLVPRMRAYVEVVFRDDQVNSPAYRVDPISTDEERNFRTSDKSRWANQDMLAGYRIWWFLYDPELKPASMFKKRVFKSYFERKIANDPDLMHAYHMRVCIHDPEKIKRMRAANDRNMEDMIAQVQESLNVQNAEAGGAAAAPAAAPGAAPAPAPAPNANAAADDDDDDDEEEVPADDAGLPAAMQQAMGQAMQHAAPDVEDQQQQAAAAGGANEAGNNNNKKKQAQKKHAHAGPNMYGGAQNRQRARLASQVREPTVKSYYRNIYDYTQLSTGVFAVLNREARNEFANRFPDGLYCRHENDLDDWCMNMHTDSAPMYVQHSFNFANSVHVLAYCGGRKAGDDNIMPTINSMQSDPENYFVGGEMRLSSCFADAWFEYKPWDLDPEMNDHWMLPWRSSPLDNEITKLQSYQIQREQMTSRLLANGQDISHLTNHSTRLFQGQGMGSLDELIGVEQYQRLCQVLDPEAGKRLAVRERSADAHQQPADDIEVDAVLRIRQPAEFDTHWQKIRSEYSAPTSDERVVQATPYANRIESRGSAGEQHNTLARQDELLERSRQRQLDLQRRVAVHRLKRMRGTMEQAQLSNSRHYDADNLARELNRLSMLEKRLEGSETVMGSDETARQNYLRMMKDPQTRGTLVVPLRQMEDAAVNPQLVEELCREMAGRSVLQQQMDRLEDAYDNIQSLSHGNDPNSTMGRQSDRVRQSLSSHVTEGPIAKLEKRTVIRRARVMTLVAASPFKHTKEAINWLKAQEPWLRHQHQTKYECEAKRVEELDAHTGQAHPLCAYDPNTFKLKWTDKLEELYRREKMCELDALLRDETMTELNCMMNINNPELAGVHKGMLLAKEDRNTDKFFSPSPTGDLGMSRWSNNIVNEMAAYEMVMGTHQNHLLMLELMKAFRYNAMRHDLRLRSHLLVQSPPGREKSDIERKLEKCCPQEAILSSDYNSSLSVYANKAEDYFIMFGDEAPHHIVGDPEKMNQQQREQRDREKTSLTKNNVAWMRNVKSSKEGSEAREQERISKSYQINKLLFCNAIQKMKASLFSPFLLRLLTL